MNTEYGSFNRTTSRNGDLSVIFSKNPDMEANATAYQGGNILDELREPS